MPRSFYSVPRALRIVAVILAITAMLCVTAAASSPGHTHLNEPVGRCNVCYTAHQATQRVSVVQIIHALELQSVLALNTPLQHLESRGVIALLTRGPPSSL